MEKKKPGDEILLTTQLNKQQREYTLTLIEPQ
jgi:hypothetical protein